MTNNQLPERLAFLQQMLEKTKAAEWVEVTLGSRYNLVAAQDEDDKYYIGVSDIPGVPLSRWVSDDLMQLNPMMRQLIVQYLESKIASLQQELEALRE